MTWAWHEAPRQNVTADVLARLIAPGPYPKRVSLQYRPFPAAAATRVLEAEVNAATFREHYRSRTGRDETARDAHDQARARQAAAEEAAGAGVCLISLYRHRHGDRHRRPAARGRLDRGRRRVIEDQAPPDDLQPGGRVRRHLAVRDLPGRAGPPLAPLTSGGQIP